MSRIVGQDEFRATGETEEEGVEVDPYENEVYFRDWLQEVWQAEAASVGGYPSRKKIGKGMPFSKFFEIGYKIKYFTTTDIAKMNQRVESISGKGLSYKDLKKAKDFLTEMPWEGSRQHRKRIRMYFENAPKTFLNNIDNFKELIPVSLGWVVEYASPRVRGNVVVGKLAACKINGWPTGYCYLNEPALSNKEVICTALSEDPANLGFTPEEVQRDLKTFQSLMHTDDEGNWQVVKNRASKKVLSIERLDEAVAWSIGCFRDGKLSDTNLLKLCSLLQESNAVLLIKLALKKLARKKM